MKVDSMQRARRVVAERRLRIKEHVSHPRGDRLNCVTPAGKPVTIAVSRGAERAPEETPRPAAAGTGSGRIVEVVR